MCPYTNPQAITFWGKACNFCRGSDLNHKCGNPAACKRTLDKAKSAEESHLLFVEEWQ
tara:strand:- start:260 stop:433 length:174 start_codon:yes stop_codon:yes gene_type:complete